MNRKTDLRQSSHRVYYTFTLSFYVIRQFSIANEVGFNYAVILSNKPFIISEKNNTSDLLAGFINFGLWVDRCVD